MVSVARQRWHHFLLTSLPTVDVWSRPKARGGCCRGHVKCGVHIFVHQLCAYLFTCHELVWWEEHEATHDVRLSILWDWDRQTSGCQVFFEDFLLSVWLLLSYYKHRFLLVDHFYVGPWHTAMSMHVVERNSANILLLPMSWADGDRKCQVLLKMIRESNSGELKVK